MAYKRSRSRVIIHEIDMTPMIDIVFLLIIFFMVAAQFARESKCRNLILPAEQGEQDAEHDPSKLVLNILPNGEIVLDNTRGAIDLTELELLVEAVIAEDGPTWQNITIRADEDSSTKILNEVLVILNRQGLSATRIATEQP